MTSDPDFHDHHATIYLEGEINSETINHCVSCIDHLITLYSYKRIEIRISSGGGRADSMLYLLYAMDRWRRGLVTIDTRGLTHAASAAAIILSLGERRVAEQTTQLCYHSCRIHTSEGGVLTAPAARHLGNSLQYQDEKMAEKLAQRAVRIPTRGWVDYLKSAGQVEFHPSGVDEQKFCTRLFDLRKGQCDEPSRDGESKLSKLMINLLTDEEFSTAKLAEIYRNLFELDILISPAVAKMLGLIDAVGEEDEAFERESANDAPEVANAVSGDEQTFVKKVLDAGDALPVWEWRELYPDGMPYQHLRRHVLIQGETGSGKTKSGILPILKAVLNTPGNDVERPRVGAMLVIDPKREFGPCLQQAERHGNLKVRDLVDHEHGGGERLRLNLMARERSALSDRGNSNRYLDEARKVLAKVASIVPNHAAATPLLGKYTARNSAGNMAFWDGQGTALSIVYVSLAMMLLDCVRDSPGRDALSGTCPRNFKEVMEDFVKSVNKGGNIIFLAKGLMSSLEKKSLFTDLYVFLDAFERAPLLCERVGGHEIKAWKREYDPFRTQAADQKLWSSLLSGAQESLFVFGDPAVSETLYFGCEPGIDTDKACLDLRACVSVDKSATEIIRYCPDLKREHGALVGKALKASFFNAVLSDPDRSNPDKSDDLPLVGYIADECHRFITADTLHGEQSYLDTCRSFGGFCVLACQSTESLKHALAQVETAYQAESALAILTQNTATKLYFRSTDIAYLENLKRLVRPGRWGNPLVHRPLFTLDCGECVAILADGHFRRLRLDWVDYQSTCARSID